jgi:cobalt/nickel transport system permease protein
MHIPDGYLGPQTFVPFFAAMVPLWSKASRTLKKTLKARHVPLFAMSAAFSFVVMMFNVPIPGGTTGHATGAAVIAILLGPWAAILSVSIALIIQAFLFGDGGITALGVNCFNIAVVISATAYFVYRIISVGAAPCSFRRVIAGGIGGYVGINLSALLTGLELGIQPLIAHNAAGQPLYAPFPLTVAIPAMLIGHLFLFGVVEAVVTALIILYFQKTDPSMLSLVEATSVPQDLEGSPVESVSPQLELNANDARPL